MAQSVELLLDMRADADLRAQWDALADAGLPSERRSGADLHHRPHITLFAADHLAAEVEGPLVEALTDLRLRLVVGSVMIFGPRHGRSILVRSVVPSQELLRLQARVAEICGADPEGQFGPGRWSPHATLARRVPSDQIGAALEVVGDRTTTAIVTECRRWDGAAKRSWLL